MRPTMYLPRKGANGAFEVLCARANARKWVVVRINCSVSVQVQVDGTFDSIEPLILTMRDANRLAKERNGKGSEEKAAEVRTTVLSRLQRATPCPIGSSLCSASQAAWSSATVSHLSPGVDLFGGSKGIRIGI